MNRNNQFSSSEKNTSRYSEAHQGKQEIARRRKQIETGRLKKENGLENE
jgi:hypothetical protein